ncbi:hypothetical protein PWT90_11218 [Aphanocladium album]|nr:hypothetical protein PWT90_11218 [Aphanocladium album]
MRRVALQQVDYLDWQWQTGQRENPEVRQLFFAPVERLSSLNTAWGPDREKRKVMGVRMVAKLMRVSLATRDWCAVLTAILGTLDSWCLEHYGEQALSPKFFDRKLRDLFGTVVVNMRTVTAQQVRDVIREAPVESLQGGLWQKNPYLAKWRVASRCDPVILYPLPEEEEETCARENGNL